MDSSESDRAPVRSGRVSRRMDPDAGRGRRSVLREIGCFCGHARKGLSLGNHPPVPLASAPAFGSAVESKDTVVAVGTPSELSQTISSILGDASTKKVYLFPIVVRQNVIAVLYAEPGEVAVDVSALELLAGLASASIEVYRNGGGQIARRRPDPDRGSLGKSDGPAPMWTDLPKT